MTLHVSACLEQPILRTVEQTASEQQEQRAAETIRWELVHRVRQEIQAGTYEDPEKLELALEEMFASLHEI